MVVEQFLGRHIPTYLNVEKECKTIAPCGPVEHLRDGLGARVVRCDSESDQPTGNRQSLEHRHLHVESGRGEQFFGRIKGGGSGADYRHTQWRKRGFIITRPSWARLHVRTRRFVSRMRGKVLGIDLEVACRALGQRVLRDYRVDGAHIGARTAVDTGARIDVQHLGALVLAFLRRRMDAIDGAHRNAGRIVATVLSDNIGHVGNSNACASQ